MTKEEKYLVAFSSFVPFGPARMGLLLRYFGSAEKSWKARTSTLAKTGLSEGLVQKFAKHRANFDAKRYFDLIKKNKLKVIFDYDDKYPERLKEIDSHPKTLYVKGNFRASDKNAVAIVGSRKMTSYGKEVARKFGEELASLGVTIVSGLARGVDSEAHKGALLAGGRTIAILGGGLDDIYPSENTMLARKISQNGCLLSEYPLGHPALPHNFAARNRIISALSKAIVVVEGESKSGTLLTVKHGLDQGKTIFAVPGQITSPLSRAPNFLIKEGAIIATDTQDILDELNMQLMVDHEEVEKILPEDKIELRLLATIANEPLHLDEIVRISNVSISQASSKIIGMEIKGLVKNMGKGMYKRV